MTIGDVVELINLCFVQFIDGTGDTVKAGHQGIVIDILQTGSIIVQFAPGARATRGEEHTAKFLPAEAALHLKVAGVTPIQQLSNTTSIAASRRPAIGDRVILTQTIKAHFAGAISSNPRHIIPAGKEGTIQSIHPIYGLAIMLDNINGVSPLPRDALINEWFAVPSIPGAAWDYAPASTACSCGASTPCTGSCSIPTGASAQSSGGAQVGDFVELIAAQIIKFADGSKFHVARGTVGTITYIDHQRMSVLLPAYSSQAENFAPPWALGSWWRQLGTPSAAAGACPPTTQAATSLSNLLRPFRPTKCTAIEASATSPARPKHGNDGRDFCWKCNKPTKSITGFMTVHQICSDKGCGE